MTHAAPPVTTNRLAADREAGHSLARFDAPGEG